MKDDFLYISHILEAISDIKQFTAGMDKNQFLGNKLVKHAIIRNIEIIGEASKQLSKEFMDMQKGIPWKDMIKMRDKAIHFYFGINYDIVWEVIERDIPELEKKLKALAMKR